MVETSGTIYPLAELPTIVAVQPRSLIVGGDIGRYLVALDDEFNDDPLWQFRVTLTQQHTHFPDGKNHQRAIALGAAVAFFGWRNDNPKEAGKYHYPLNPADFCRSSIGEIDRTDAYDMQKYLRFGIEVRDFCETHGLQLRPSAGGLAAQLLKHPAFYPEPRRRVPQFLNKAARERLPGNHYELHTEVMRPHFFAFCLDMQAAHHHAASSVQFPCANSLHAYGHLDGETKVWAKARTKRFDDAIGRPGLFHLQLSVPVIRGDRFPLPFMQSREKVGQLDRRAIEVMRIRGDDVTGLTPARKEPPSGLRDAWVFSNEIPTLLELGGSIEAIYGAYVSDDTDPGLNLYGAWAQRQLASGRWQKGWLKPVLHSTYGLLAVRPHRLEMGFKHASGGTREKVVIGNTEVELDVVRGKHEQESRTANVVQRGMIEAEIRLQVLALARQLTAQGLTVLNVYADSLFVQLPKGGQFPILPAPWIVKTSVSGIRFLSATHFSCKAMTRLPGIPESAVDNYLQESGFRPTPPLYLPSQVQEPATAGGSE